MKRAFFVQLLLVAFPIYSQHITTAITGGTLVNTNGEAPLKNAVVLMSGNRITQVGPGTEVGIPPEVAVISAKDKWIIPGLIDAHIHFFQSGGLYTRPD
ncbi:MAG: amidohydrolase, partial [Fidelibacterota bacterium]